MTATLFPVEGNYIRHEPVIGIDILICRKPLQPLNGDGFIDQTPSALFFTGMGHTLPRDPGMGILFRISSRVVKPAVGNQANITLTVGLSRKPGYREDGSPPMVGKQQLQVGFFGIP